MVTLEHGSCLHMGVLHSLLHWCDVSFLSAFSICLFPFSVYILHILYNLFFTSGVVFFQECVSQLQILTVCLTKGVLTHCYILTEALCTGLFINYVEEIFIFLLGCTGHMSIFWSHRSTPNLLLQLNFHNLNFFPDVGQLWTV